MREERREEEREVDYVAACCHAVCCLVLWTMYLLFESFDLPQWVHVFPSRCCCEHFAAIKLHFFYTSSRA